jgi:antibiotic biosynthesis monooxygenase (ABM) superfamily enzyme
VVNNGGMSPEESGNRPLEPQTPGDVPVTVSITRLVDPHRVGEVTRWVQTGVNLANRYPGFLGSGWVRSSAESLHWHMLYRFASQRLLDDWEQSVDRRDWLETGRDLVRESRVERRTGIEGWFDVPQQSTAAVAPPRWKQAISIWLGFFPVNLGFTVLVTWLVPGWNDVAVVGKVLITTVILTPLMAYWVLPFVTRLLRPWLIRNRASANRAQPGQAR